MKRGLMCAAVVGVAMACGAAQAQQPQNYPTKLVRFIVTYPPGAAQT